MKKLFVMLGTITTLSCLGQTNYKSEYFGPDTIKVLYMLYDSSASEKPVSSTNGYIVVDPISKNMTYLDVNKKRLPKKYSVLNYWKPEELQ
jgi:hypothetical protein